MTKTEHRISSAYHPQTNGLVERFNQTLQRSLVKFVKSNQTDWDEKLDGVLFAYRTSQQKSTSHTPFELMYCRKPVLPIEIAMTNHQTSGDDDDDSSRDDANIECYMKEMVTMRDELFDDAKSNITQAQLRHKRDYDKKHGRKKVKSYMQIFICSTLYCYPRIWR